MKKVYLKDIVRQTETDLGADAQILFILPNGAEIIVSHAGRQDLNGTLSVRVENGTVRVIPRVSNAVCIEVTDAINVRGEPPPPRLTDRCEWPGGCTGKRLRGLTFCRRHQPYPAK